MTTSRVYALARKWSEPPERSEALSEADFLYVSKRWNHGWNYLFYVWKDGWTSDPFRQVVTEMIKTGQARSILGSVLTPIHNGRTSMIARIDPEQKARATTHVTGDDPPGRE